MQYEEVEQNMRQLQGAKVLPKGTGLAPADRKQLTTTQTSRNASAVTNLPSLHRRVNCIRHHATFETIGPATKPARASTSSKCKHSAERVDTWVGRCNFVMQS